MKEPTVGDVFKETFSGRRRAVTGYIPASTYKIWKQLKQDCVENDLSLSYDGMTEMLNIYLEIRNIVCPLNDSTSEEVFKMIHDKIKEMSPLETKEKTITDKILRR